MRGTIAKAIRRHVRNSYKFLMDERMYRITPSGTIVLAEQCKRALTQSMKRTYKKRKRDGKL